MQVRQETETRETRERGAEKRGPTGRHFHIQDGLEMFAPALRRTQQKTTIRTIHLIFSSNAAMPPKYHGSYVLQQTITGRARCWGGSLLYQWGA